MTKALLLPIALLASFAATGACKREPEPAPSADKPAGAASVAPAANAGAPLVLARGVRFAKPASGDVAEAVRSERAAAAADGRKLIVYVGAKWCEPCQRFHQAAKAGALDTEFPELTILEFDLDEDRERLMAAGYRSKLIPLFVLPDERGNASERRFEGGVKGDGAVENIVPRLRRLLDS